MPKICEHCGKMHATQEELEAKGNEELPSSEPLPHEFPPEEAPETLEEKYVPKKSKKSKKSEAAF